MGPISQNLTKTFNSNVYVKYIPNDISEDEVKKTFSQAGNIISMRIDKCVRNIGGSEV
jgi:RNA recognition motif-containing protein